MNHLVHFVAVSKCQEFCSLCQMTIVASTYFYFEKVLNGTRTETADTRHES